MKVRINDTLVRKVTLESIYLIPALLLQKHFKSSKSKVHHAALDRRLKLWEEGKIKELLCKGQTIQKRLKSPNSK